MHTLWRLVSRSSALEAPTRAAFSSLLVIVLTFGVAVPRPIQGIRSSTHPPNIVVILADDLGYGDISGYNATSAIRTPNLDRLIAGGMRFTDAHSPSAVCSPTRYSLLTGRYAWRTELKRHVLWAFDPPLIEPNRLTLPKLLSQQGYKTTAIGKWHLGWHWQTTNGQRLELPFQVGTPRRQAQRIQLARTIDYSQKLGGGPLAAGFDYYFGDGVINQPPYLWIENDRYLNRPTLPEHPALLRGSSNGPAEKDWDQMAVLPTLTERATRYIRDHAKQEKDRPFFLYFSLTAPHLPIVPPPSFEGQSEVGPYGDFVTYVDWIVGQVLTALKESGLEENTLVVFTSDNGSYATPKHGHLPNGPFRGNKGSIFEGGHRVPFIVRWTSRVAAGSTNRQLIGLNDLMATVADIVDWDLSSEAAEDSISILPTLLDPSIPIRHELVHHSGSGEFAIRVGKWKLIPRQYLLFNLDQDPQERDNHWRRHPNIRKTLQNRLATIRGEQPLPLQARAIEWIKEVIWP